VGSELKRKNCRWSGFFGWNLKKIRNLRWILRLETEMKKTILVIYAVLMTSSVALADDFSGNLQYDSPAAQQRVVNKRYGDAAPRSVVVKAPASIDYSGTAAISGKRSIRGPRPTNESDR
jgi:hypothetical protein